MSIGKFTSEIIYDPERFIIAALYAGVKGQFAAFMRAKTEFN